MSSNTPPPGDPSQPEYLHLGAGEPLGPEPRSKGRGRRVAAVVVGLAVVGLVGGGAWAWNAWFNQGPQPSESLPAGTLGYVSIDIDPTGQQKVEAIGFLRKFPAFKDKVGLDTGDDVRQKLFELIQEEGACKDLDYEDDVEPWLGERAAFAAVDRGKEAPAPVAVVQVKDEGKAEEGVEKLIACSESGGELSSGSDGSSSEGSDAEGSEEGGYAFDDGWMVVAETEKLARSVIEDAQESSLADDEDFQEWTEAAGDPGVITMYASPEAGKAMLEFGDDAMGLGAAESFGSETDETGDVEMPGLEDQLAGIDEEISRLEQELADLPEGARQRAALESQLEVMRGIRDDMAASADDEPTEESAPGGESAEEMPEEAREALEKFPGGAAIVRFDDDDLEIEVAYGQVDSALSPLVASEGGGDVVATLPATTAAALGLGFSEGWGDAMLEQVSPMLDLFLGADAEEEIEAQTGLVLPEDIETLFGESAAFAVDGSIDIDAIEDEDPSGIPAGIKIKGDPEAIEEVLGKIRKAIGPGSEMLVSETEGDYVVVGLSPDYLEELAEDGKLGDEETFSDVVPEAEGSSAVFYVNFDAQDWLDNLASEVSGDDKEIVDNLKPLDSFGVSSWMDDDQAHGLIKLTTD